MALGEVGLTINEWISITHRDYVSLLVGYFRKQRRQEYIDRSLQYLVMASGTADRKALPKIENWWKIEGETTIKKIKIPSAKKLAELDTIFRNLGRKKHG